MIVKSQKHRRNRNAIDPAVPALGTTTTPTATIAATKLQLDFDVAVACSALPTGITVQGVAPTAFVQNSATRITLTYAANVVATNVVVIPPTLPQIRTRNGGFVQSKTVTL